MEELWHLMLNISSKEFAVSAYFLISGCTSSNSSFTRW
jgi:hypothetical protein